MVKIYNVHKAIENLTPIVNRGESTPEEVVVAGFEILGRGDFHDAAINLGTFNGDAGWERHSQGDEIVHIVAGETAIQMLVDGERQTIQVSAGDLLVVPQGTWHRLQSEKGVTVLTATPEGHEDHAFVDDPRTLYPC